MFQLNIFVFIAVLKILEGKVALYKRGYHVLLQRLKKVNSEKKFLSSEVKRLTRVVKMHEDIFYYF